MSLFSGYGVISLPLQVGIVGTGFAAKIRAQTFLNEPRTNLLAVGGNNYTRSQELADSLNIAAENSWQELVSRPEIDLIVVCTINSNHGKVIRTALENGKHVIVEYPLSLDVEEGRDLINLAKRKGRLLHVEHIELLGGLHQTMKELMPKIAPIYYARYSTVVPQRPAPKKWTFNDELFGFPLTGALSRLHRFTDLFGKVASVNCHNQYWGKEDGFFKTCLCSGQMRFENGVIGEVIYGKGEGLWTESRRFEVHGEKGAMIFDGDQGVLIEGDQTTNIDLGGRKGLFAKDTEMVLDHLINNLPLYVDVEDSLYTLTVAEMMKVASK